ncbi:MAG: CDP-diacylglycerol--serine O-phosphatidyltransferase [Deltaproteobacteria bacterium]|nr:CDP-diacylglycerol--serine O-phosphatidyltransferase [Deltaproteobacteria bacterium]MBI3296356.1 CDP-diacylglycerol--serine O-phosphatidyltransferase [Deltaproteobacteria bacterium]
MFTTGNLFCGFYSIVHTYNHDFERASWAIIFAGIFDVLDGRVARITKSQSNFGMEYDSIADVVSFGIAPALLAYVGFLESYGQLGWAGAFFFAACGALRLARFNTIADEMPKSYFVGLPIPAAAYLIAASVIAYHSFHFFYPSLVMLFLVFALGLLMVSVVRYRSFKDFDLRHRRSFFLLVLLVLLLALAAVRPEITLATIIGYYVCWGPLGEVIAWLRKKRETPEGLVRKEETK